jgi:hypothetical protein
VDRRRQLSRARRLFIPYVATARFLAYLDLRTRSEGWDIQTRFAAIALRAAEVERRAA